MKIIKILSTIGLLLITVNSNAQKPHYIKTDKYEGIVNTDPKDFKGRTRIYIPTDNEIANMEKKIPVNINKFVKDYKMHGYANKSCDIDKNLSKYKRIYMGLNMKGENLIIISFFKYLPKNWKTTMPQKNAGGLCDDFLLQYNIKKDSLIGLFPGEE